MFTIEWLHRTDKVDRTMTQTSDIDDAVKEARNSADAMRDKHAGKAPDNFRLMDASGAEVGTYSVDAEAYGVTSNA